MTFRTYLILMAAATVLCGGAWGIVIVNIDPFSTNAFGFLFFYAGAFLMLFGLLSVASCTIWYVRSQEPLYALVKKSFGLAISVSATLTLFLALQGFALLEWWIAAVFLVAVACLGGFLLISRRSALS